MTIECWSTLNDYRFWFGPVAPVPLSTPFRHPWSWCHCRCISLGFPLRLTKRWYAQISESASKVCATSMWSTLMVRLLKQTSVTFYPTASLLNKEGAKVVYAHMDIWWICRSDSCWREWGHNLFTRTSILLAAIHVIRQNLACCRETSHNPESPSDEGQNLRKTTMSMLAMRILDDQVCHVMFTRKNNGALHFERNWNILEATYPQYSFKDKRIQVAYWTRPWDALPLVPRRSLAYHS